MKKVIFCLSLFFTQGFLCAMKKRFWVPMIYVQTLKETLAIRIAPDTTVGDIKQLLKTQYSVPYNKQEIAPIVGVKAGIKEWPIEGSPLNNHLVIKDIMNLHTTNIFTVWVVSED